jgi:serine/threonine protein kinase
MPSAASGSTTDSDKYFVHCPPVTADNPTTEKWLWITDLLVNSNVGSEHVILKGLQTHVHRDDEDVVIKLGKKGDLLKTDYDVAQKLHANQVPAIIKYMCYFACNDDQDNYKHTTRGPLCHGPGDCMRAIVMPYMQLGSLKAYKGWDSHEQVKSCLKQALAAIVQAYDRCAIVMTDRHSDNVLLRRSSRPTATFCVEGHNFQLKTHGMLVLHMDFECAIDFGLAGLGHHPEARKLMLLDLDTFLRRFHAESRSFRFADMSACPLPRLYNAMPLSQVLSTLFGWIDGASLEQALSVDELLHALVLSRGE